MKMDKNSMLETMRLIKSGDLRAATAEIQRQLGNSGSEGAPPAAQMRTVEGKVIDGEFEIVQSESRSSDAFPELHFECAAGKLNYRLFLPSGRVEGLLLMLHGCTQSPIDFARGTRMNARAAQQGLAVVWPTQITQRNHQKCWNWFRKRDQQALYGESALLRNLVLHLQHAHQLLGLPVYGAGLSAGGAMIMVLARSNPQLFAAIGVHSGLPAGIAHDLPSALAAMKQTGKSPPPLEATVPCIVFHGDADATVHPDHARAIADQCLGPLPRAALKTDIERSNAQGRAHTRTLLSTQNGAVVSEQWTLHGAGHAWSGGDPTGSWTDAQGPDASALMLRFFASHAEQLAIAA